jgi:Na+/proline symporter
VSASATATSFGPLPKRRNVLAVWLGLPIITLGIYSYVWYYKINRETKFSPHNEVSPGVAVIALLFGWILIVPPFISVYKTGKRIAEAQRVAGVGSSCSPVIGFILIFVFGLWTLYYQSEMNKIPAAYAGHGEGSMVALRVA